MEKEYEPVTYEPVTKESLIRGILLMFSLGSISKDIAVHEIKRYATDERLSWKVE